MSFSEKNLLWLKKNRQEKSNCMHSGCMAVKVVCTCCVRGKKGLCVILEGLYIEAVVKLTNEH